METNTRNHTLSVIEPDPQQSGKRVLFYDDFASDELDRSRWNIRITGGIVNNEQQAYVDSSETLYIIPGTEVPGATNGVLVLHPQYRPGHVTPEGQRFDFISGRIDTREKFDFCYGSAAARIRLPSGAGLWPAFWALGYEPWPASGEIDILEYVGEPDWVSAAVHGPNYSGEAGLVNKLFFPTVDDAKAWHIYSVDWSPDRLIFKVDGVTFYRVTRPMAGFFGPWVFDNQKYLILNFALGGVYPFKTNGIGNPYFGLPESTVRLIKDDQVKMMVDWIQVEA
ncbi:MAG: glycoside hydrolase family 16 protein [Chloroflexota bacterium]